MYGDGFTVRSARYTSNGCAPVSREALRHRDLVRIAALDVLLRALDLRQKAFARVVRSERALRVRRARRVVRQPRERAQQPADEFLDLPRRLPVRASTSPSSRAWLTTFDLVLRVVEDERRIDEQEDRLGEALRVGIGHGRLLVVARTLVRHVADGAAVEAQQAFDGHGREAPQLVLDLQQRVAGRLVQRGVLAGAQHAIRLRADETVPRERSPPSTDSSRNECLPRTTFK